MVLADVQVISSSLRAQDKYLNIVRVASEEILWIFPTTNAFLRQVKLGAIQELKQNCPSGTIDIKYLGQTSDTKATILVVDRKDSMVMELKDDSKATFAEAIGLSKAIYRYSSS